MTLCKNCATEFEGKFCPECGQKAKTGRITIRQVFKEIQSHFIHFDQGFLFTIKEMTLRPGHTVREYIAGKRVQHVKPVKFMFWSTAISFLFTHYAGLQDKVLKQIENQSGAKPNTPQLGQKLSDFITGHPSLVILFILPAIAFCSWLFFRKKGYNYAEHFTVSAFLLGEMSLFSILISAGYLWLDRITLAQMAFIGSFQWVLWLIYYGWAYQQFFEGKQKFKTWLKADLVLIAGYTLMILVTMLLISTILFWYKPQVETWLAQ